MFSGVQSILRLVVKTVGAGKFAFRKQLLFRRQPVLDFVSLRRTLVHIMGRKAAWPTWGVQKSFKFECAANDVRALRPIRNGFQLKIDLFSVQDWHNFNLTVVCGPQAVSPGAH
jgi:hypothetical protein